MAVNFTLVRCSFLAWSLPNQQHAACNRGASPLPLSYLQGWMDHHSNKRVWCGRTVCSNGNRFCALAIMGRASIIIVEPYTRTGSRLFKPQLSRINRVCPTTSIYSLHQTCWVQINNKLTDKGLTSYQVICSCILPLRQLSHCTLHG